MNQTKEKILLTGLLLLVLAVGFFIGRGSIKMNYTSTGTLLQDVGEISKTVPVLHMTSFQKGLLYGVTNGHPVRIITDTSVIPVNKDGTFFVDTNNFSSRDAISNEGYLYVGSKNSNKYHPIDSSVAGNIKPENKVYFISKEDAAQKGYIPGSSVK